jgi:hypothetical protein
MIPLEHDGEPSWIAENCCFCYARTNWWYAKKDVAVCPACAAKRQPEEVPSKIEWCKAVRARFKPAWCP